jgi:threonine/homoserine/homoserine lactone efflux protein
VGNHGGVARGVATVVSTIVVVLATTTAVAAVIVPMPVVVAAITIVGAAAIVLARRARRRQWSRQRFVLVECRRSSSWTGGVQVDFLHHGIRLDVEVGDDGVDV